MDDGLGDLLRLTDRRPTDLAVIAGEARITVGEFRKAVAAVCRLLSQNDVHPSDAVGVPIQRSHDTLVGIWGALCRGAIFVPFDMSGLPIHRYEGLVRALLVTRDNGGHHLIHWDNTKSRGKEHHQDLAYAMPTSGSSGAPKLVAITRDNVVAYSRALVSILPLASQDRYLHLASLSASSSVRQWLAPLVSGATVVLASDNARRDVGRLVQETVEAGVTVLDIVPSHFGALVDWLRHQPSWARRLGSGGLRTVVLASEPLYRETVLEWDRLGLAHVELVHMYGQTETAGVVLGGDGRAGREDIGIVPIGQPLGETEVRLTDGPEGGKELVLHGKCIGAGYFMEAAGAWRLVPFPRRRDGGHNWYHTGDLVEKIGDELYFQGRMDGLVKVNGQGVSTVAVEAVIHDLKAVRAVVVGMHLSAGGPVLMAVVESDRPISAGEIRCKVRTKLPANHVPTMIRFGKIPRTPNGKLDRRCALHDNSGSRR